MKPRETPWDLDQRLKCTIREANMNLTNGQHREWFIAPLTLHLGNVMSQERLTTLAEALEATMRLHENLT